MSHGEMYVNEQNSVLQNRKLLYYLTKVQLNQMFRYGRRCQQEIGQRF